MSCAGASWSGLRGVWSRGNCQGEAATCSTITADVPMPSARVLGWLNSGERAQMYSSSSLRPGSRRVGSRRCAGERSLSSAPMRDVAVGNRCAGLLIRHLLGSPRALLRVPSRVQHAVQAV